MGYQAFNLVNAMQLEVPAHGVRLLRMWPLPQATLPACWCKPPLLPCCNATPPPSPAPARACPSGFAAPGYWYNTDPSAGCVAFEVSRHAQTACYIFLNSLTAPFTPYAGGTLTCIVKH
eukprot:SAG11_NODE_57_length_19200_cov_18.288417_14_plen_119_part_00